MTALPILIAGIGLGLCATALAHSLASLFWPLVALEVLSLVMVFCGLGGLAVAAAPATLRERFRRGRTPVALVGALAAAAAIVSAGPVARLHLPGPGLGVFSLPPLFLIMLTAPFLATAGAFSSWCGEGLQRRVSWLLGGFAAGCLAAALLTAANLAVLAPWSGSVLEFADAGGGSTMVGVDRRLREDLFAPEQGAVLAFAPLVGNGPREILVVGLTSGPVLESVLKRARDSLTILEEDAALVHEALKRWPRLARAHRRGRVTFVGGSGRWALERLTGRFDLIVLGENWSGASFFAHALSHRRDYRWTTEALGSCLSRLKPHGVLFAQRTGIGRVVATLREASGLPGTVFSEKIVVFGRGQRLVSECWFSPAGFVTNRAQRLLWAYKGYTHALALYNPVDGVTLNPYRPLAFGERIRGMYFTTPVDLSPTRDERPFFDSTERLTISPVGRPLPEEFQQTDLPSRLLIVPRSDRTLWGMLLAGLVIGAVIVWWALRGGAREGNAPEGVAAALGSALFLGAAAGLTLEAFSAWSEWIAPNALAAGSALAALYGGLAAGWARSPGAAPRRLGQVTAAGLLLLFGGAGYRLLPVAVRGGTVFAFVALAATGALLGLALGRALREASAAHEGEGDQTSAGWFTGGVLLAAALAGVGGTLAATHFGYRLLWVLAAVALLAALRNGRRRSRGRAT